MQVLSHRMFKDKTIFIEFTSGESYGNLTILFDTSLDNEIFEVTTSITGYDVTGLPFKEEQITLKGDTAQIIDETPLGRKVNPTRVFWLVYRVAKKVLCPECV